MNDEERVDETVLEGGMDEESPSTAAFVRLRRLEVMISTYETVPGPVHDLQKRAVERIHSELEVLWNAQLDEQLFQQVTALMSRVQALLSGYSESASAKTESTVGSSGDRDRKTIATRDLPFFTGHVLEYPLYRAHVQNAIMALDNRTPSEKYLALCRTLGRGPLGYLGEVNPESPDLDRVWQLLDEEYLSGVNVEDALKREVMILEAVKPQSSVRKWVEFRNAVQKLQKRVEAGTLSLTAEKMLYQLLLTKLSPEDRQTAAMKGSKMSDLVGSLRKFVNRARALVEEPMQSSRQPSGDHRFSDGRHGIPSRRMLTHTITSPSCLFCGKLHEMTECPLPVRLRYKALKEAKRCWTCLDEWGPNHQCRGSCPECGYRHHISLCGSRTTKRGGEGPYGPPPKRRTNVAIVTATRTKAEPAVYLPSLRVQMRAPGGETLTGRVFLDSGSTDSYVSATFAKALGADLKEESPRSVHAFGGEVHFRISQLTEVQLVGREHVATLSVMVMPPNVVAPLDVPTASYCKRLTVQVAAGESPLEDVDLLIGTPHRVEHFTPCPPQHVVISSRLMAIKSRFGWFLEGQHEGGSDQPSRTFAISNMEQRCMCLDVDQLLRDPLSSRNDGDKSVAEWVEQTLTRITYDPRESRWSVPLFWINEQRPTNNRAIVYCATRHQVKKANARGIRELYDKAISVYIDGDFAERVYDDPPNAYYIPHHHVEKPGSTTEIRVVMNASFARRGQLSLNDCVGKGPSDQNNLFRLLVRWRTNVYAVTADLKQAFLQIRVHQEDRDYLRFFWAKKGTDELQTYRMKSVMFGATASPAQLYMVLKKIFQSAPEPEIRNMVESIYMDDTFFLASDLVTVRKMIDIARRVLGAASFPLHKWACPEWIQAEGLSIENLKKVTGCLGLHWDLTTDACSLKEPSTEIQQYTRRGIAQVVGRLHDVLGLLGPFNTRMKLLLSETLAGTKGWDSPVDGTMRNAASELFSELPSVAQFSFPRVLLSSGQYEIVGFADASRRAYGAVIYLWEQGASGMRLLASRSRIVSEKRTIPELELCAAVLLTDLLESVRPYLPPASRVRLCSDSMVTLGRIRQDKPNKYQQYVANRLTKIKQVTRPEQWHFVPTDMNPADPLSRGLSLKELKDNSLWFSGPDPLLLKETLTSHVYSTSSKAVIPLPIPKAYVLDEKTLAMGYTAVIRFFTGLYTAMDSYTHMPQRENGLGGEQLTIEQMAVAAAWRLYQRVMYPKEVKLLKAKEFIPRSSELGDLKLILDQQGIMRLDRRLKEAPLDFEAKYPIIAKDHPFVRSFLEHFHSVTLAHGSLRRTEVEVNNLLYLPNCHNVLRSVLGSCIRCQFLRGRPFNATPAALPADRVNNSEQMPFSHIGVDLFGPILARGVKQSYGMIFVCSNTRAMHLELVPNKSAPSILRAFQRFVARRGTPRVIRSDNEKSFHKLSSPLQELFTEFIKCRRQLCDQYSFAWLFQPANSPFWGGFFERLIGVVKSTFANWPLTRRYTNEELSTILCEVEALVNSRPILPGTLETSPLTPAHFLVGRSISYRPPLRMGEKPINSALTNYVTLCAERDRLWTRLRTEYLTGLRRFHRKKAPTREPKVGELVLLIGSSKRESWDWGKIQSLMRGQDGVVRAAYVYMPNGNTWERPIQSLIPLESTAEAGGCGEPPLAITSSADGQAVDANGTEATEAEMIGEVQETCA